MYEGEKDVIYQVRGYREESELLSRRPTTAAEMDEETVFTTWLSSLPPSATSGRRYSDPPPDVAQVSVQDMIDGTFNDLMPKDDEYESKEVLQG